ncbi:hypothetical protein AtEden1_Chr2g0225501 [Arabidopsis thaliana]
MQTFDSGKRVNAACSRWVSSFALFEGEDLVCYQCSSNKLSFPVLVLSYAEYILQNKTLLRR